MTTITISATITSSVIKGGASAQIPVNTIAPVVSGSTSIGSVLSCTTGTWTGTAPITYSYQWVRGMADIPGATSSTYTLVEADAGNDISCQVTATNIVGSSSVSSNALSIPLLLDSYPNAAVAYSVRKLRTAYSGAALRVRRSSDNAESDIGFVSNQLDTASLLSFVGAGNGFVTTWYDQSGNGNNVTQTTAANQPRIVNAGVLETQNGKVTVRFDGSNDVLSKTNVNILNNKNYGVSFIVNKWNAIPISTSRNLFYISTNTTGNTRFSLSGTTTSNYNLAGRRLDTDSAQIMASISTFNISTTNLNTSIIDYSNSDGYIYINNQLNNSNLSFLTNGNTSITNSNLMSIGALDQSNNQANANISEVIFYESSQNISAINTNINSYYSIYSSGPIWDGSQSGMLNTYSGAAVAYSVRALNSAYTGPLIRVRRSSDNAERDIFALYNGELDTTFLLNFVGVGNGFVTTWYDQSGNARNASTTIASYQPRIVNAGSLEINVNNKPAVRFIDTSAGAYGNYIGLPNWFSANQSWVGVFSVYQLNNLTYTNNLQGSSPNGRGFHLLHSTTGQPRAITYRTAATTGTGTALNASQVYLRYDLANRVNIQTYINGSGTPNINIADTNTDFILGSAIALGSSDSTTFTFDTPISEFIGYVIDQSANKTGIETNIKTYFGI